MDILKLCKKVLENENIKHIPIVYIYAIVISVVDAISTGECFYETEIE